MARSLSFHDTDGPVGSADALRIKYAAPGVRSMLTKLDAGKSHSPIPNGSWAYVCKDKPIALHSMPEEALRAALSAGSWDAYDGILYVELRYVYSRGHDGYSRPALIHVRRRGSTTFEIEAVMPIGIYEIDNLGQFDYEILKTTAKRLETGSTAVRVVIRRSDGRRGAAKIEIGSLERNCPTRPMRWPVDGLNLYARRYYADWCPRAFLSDSETIFEIAGAAAMKAHSSR